MRENCWARLVSHCSAADLSLSLCEGWLCLRPSNSPRRLHQYSDWNWAAASVGFIVTILQWFQKEKQAFSLTGSGYFVHLNCILLMNKVEQELRPIFYRKDSQAYSWNLFEFQPWSQPNIIPFPVPLCKCPHSDTAWVIRTDLFPGPPSLWSMLVIMVRDISTWWCVQGCFAGAAITLVIEFLWRWSGRKISKCIPSVHGIY